MKQRDLAKKAKITESMVSQMLSGKKAAGDDLSLLLEFLTGIPAEKWRDKKVTKKHLKKARGLAGYSQSHKVRDRSNEKATGETV